MKKNKLIILVFVISSLFLILWACQKEAKKVDLKVSNDSLIQSAKIFLTMNVSTGVINKVDFDHSIIYRLGGNTVGIRTALKDLPDSSNFILIVSRDHVTWAGNYVSIIEPTHELSFRSLSIKTTSFDSTRVEINTPSAHSRLTAMAAPSMTIGVPTMFWLSFAYSLQTQYPEAFNWYYPDNTPPPTTGGGGTGQTVYYDPYLADNVIYDQQLIDSFPCVKNILDTISSYGNLNQRAQVALNEIFNVGKKIHLTIKIENSWTKDTTTDADTKTDSAWTTTFPDGSEGLDFYATIRLNPWVLKNSTKEYIALTIIHEAFHAYIDYKYYQYTKHIIDSSTFKALFPLYWPPRQIATGVYAIPNPTLQHNVMATSLIQAMCSPLYALTNNQMSVAMKDSIYRSFAWGGLGESNIWRTKPDTCDIKAINSIGRDTSLGSGHSFGPFSIPGCSSNYGISYSSFNLKTPCQ